MDGEVYRLAKAAGVLLLGLLCLLLRAKLVPGPAGTRMPFGATRKLLRSRLPQDHRQALDAITAQRLPTGLEWAPVALEADSFAREQPALDWLLTLRTAGRSDRRTTGF